MDATVTISMKSDDQLRHKEEIGGVVYKYDLPSGNTPIAFKNVASLTTTNEVEMNTPNQ